MAVSVGIGTFLKIPHEQTAIVTAGMEFGRQITILRNLVYRSQHPNKKRILDALGKLQNESKRNIFAHSILFSDEKKATFVERSRGGDYKVTAHSYTVESFAEHVGKFIKMGVELTEALDQSPKDFHEFSMVLAKPINSETTSPEPPSKTT